MVDLKPKTFMVFAVTSDTYKKFLGANGNVFAQEALFGAFFGKGEPNIMYDKLSASTSGTENCLSNVQDVLTREANKKVILSKEQIASMLGIDAETLEVGESFHQQATSAQEPPKRAYKRRKPEQEDDFLSEDIASA